jgi:hypothetical protein
MRPLLGDLDMRFGLVVLFFGIALRAPLVKADRGLKDQEDIEAGLPDLSDPNRKASR